MNFIEKLGRSLNRLRFPLFVGFLLLINFMKFGVSPIGSEFVGWLRTSAESFPIVDHYLISSLLPIWLMKILGYPGDYSWWILGLVLWMTWILITIKLLKNRYPRNFRISVALFIASAPVSTSISMVGHVDIFTLIGCSLAFLGTSKKLLWLGSIIAVGGNADHAIAILASLVLLAISGSSSARNALNVWAPVSISAFVMIHLVLKPESDNNALQIVLSEISTVASTSLGSWHLIVFSTMGLLWIPWIFLALPNSKPGSSRFFLIAGAAVLPFSLSFLVLDGTRVGVTIGYAALLITFVDLVSDREISEHLNNRLLGISVGLIALFPTIVVQNSGVLRLPFRKFLEQFGLI